MYILSNFKKVYNRSKYICIASKRLSSSTFKCKKCDNLMNSEGILGFFCNKCKWPIEPGMLKNMTVFGLFKMREKYNIDKNLLSQKHKQYQFMLHPDKHANKSPDELDLITSNSSLVNTYYSTLLDDKKRAKCLFVMKYGKEKFEKMISKRVEDQLEQIMEAHEKVESLGSEEERKELKEEFEKKIEDSVNKIGMSFENEVNTKTNKRVQEPDSIIDNYRYLSFYRQIYEKLK